MFKAELMTVTYANLDDDPASETAALVRCRYGEATEQMVIAFDRDGSGAIVTLGKVVEGFLWTVQPAAAGGVTVDVSDTMACCSMSEDNEFHQQRTYAWSGGEFRQTAGPTSWTGKPYVTDLAVTGSPIVFGPVKDGKRTATFTATVRNAGPVASGRFQLSLDLDNATTTSKYLSIYRGQDCPRSCHAPLAPGASVTLTFTVSTTKADLGSSRTDLYVNAVGVNDLGDLDDPDRANNKAAVDVRVG